MDDQVSGEKLTEKIDPGDTMDELDYEANDTAEEEVIADQTAMNEVTKDATDSAKNTDATEEMSSAEKENKEEVVKGNSAKVSTGNSASQEKEEKRINNNGCSRNRGGRKDGEVKTDQKKAEKRRAICKPCNLVFDNFRWLDTHVKSGDHSHVVKGFKPSSGRYFCYLCWLGFGHPEMLLHHLKKPDHLTRARRKGVYGCLCLPGQGSSRSRSRSSRRADRSRSPVRIRLGDYYELSSVGECETRGAKPRKIETSKGKENPCKTSAAEKSDLTTLNISDLKEKDAMPSVASKGQNKNPHNGDAQMTSVSEQSEVPLDNMVVDVKEETEFLDTNCVSEKKLDIDIDNQNVNEKSTEETKLTNLESVVSETRGDYENHITNTSIVDS